MPVAVTWKTRPRRRINKNSHFIFSKLSVIPDLLKGDVVGNDNIEYIRARNIKISSDSELESDVDGDKSDNLPVEIKVLGQHIEVFSQPKE